MNQLKIIKLLALALFIIVILAVGYFVGMITSINIPSWFIYLKSPLFVPPNWIFTPVWTILYIMIAISSWLIFKQGQFKEKAFIVYVIQLGLNFLWSLYFSAGIILI